MDVRTAYEEFCVAKLTLSKHTQKNYRVHLTVFVAWCEEQGLQLEHLTARHIRTFIDVVSKRNSPYGGTLKRSTIQQYGIAVKAFLKWCTREEDFEDLISSKAILQVQLPKLDQTVIETFSPEQLDAMLRATEKQPFPVRDKAILSVLIDTGIRASELCGLTLNCVWMDSDDSYIRVTGKGRKEREISLGRNARIALRRYITRYRKPKSKTEQHVFLSRTGEPLTTSGLAQIIEQIGLTARIKAVRCSPHTFRHTYAVQVLLNGGDLYKLSRTMGHASVKVTERYLSSIRSKQARQGQSVLDQLKD
jgi:integrase/recombinase XerD